MLSAWKWFHSLLHVDCDYAEFGLFIDDVLREPSLMRSEVSDEDDAHVTVVSTPSESPQTDDPSQSEDKVSLPDTASFCSLPPDGSSSTTMTESEESPFVGALAAAEQGVAALSPSGVRLSVFGYCGRVEGGPDVRPRVLPARRRTGLPRTNLRPGTETNGHADTNESQLDTLDGAENTTVQLTDVNQQLLESGAAILLGCKDVGGREVILVSCHHPAWKDVPTLSDGLGEIFLYYHSVTCEDEEKDACFTVVVDATNTTQEVIDVLLATLHTFKMKTPSLLDTVHVVADRAGQCHLFQSPGFQPQTALQLNLLVNVTALENLIDRRHLPSELGGDHLHDQGAWVQFKRDWQELRNLLLQTQQTLLSISCHLAVSDGPPTSAREALQLLEQHDDESSTLPAVLSLECHPAMTVVDGSTKPCHCSDSWVTTKNRRFCHEVMTAMKKVKTLMAQRREALEACLQLREFEEESSQVINWLCAQGEEILKKHEYIADNLQAIETQRHDFEKLYLKAMPQIEKGRSMLEQASILAQSEHFSEVSGIKEVAAELRGHMDHFTTNIENLRRKVEDTDQCYHLLDQTYEWALGAMRFIAAMRVERVSSDHEARALLASLHTYPAAPPSGQLDAMTTLAANGSERLRTQVSAARERCIDTQRLLSRAAAQLQRVAEPAAPSGVVLRRRSYAGPASTPAYGIDAAAFLQHERGIMAPLVEDHRTRVVAAFPKSLRGSRDSLRGSTENLATSERRRRQNEAGEDLNRKTFSMITGSTESLQHLPEEEEEEAANQTMTRREDSAKVDVWQPVNSDLSRAPVYQSMADLRISDMQREKTLSLVLAEIVQTERNYIRALQFVVTHYIPELSRDDVPSGLRGRRNLVFGNLEQIAEFHSRSFLAGLEACVHSPFKVAQCFLQHESEFYLYALYNKNKPKSDQLMMEYGCAFFKEKQRQLGDRMDLCSYLLKPVQRMGKYALLLRQILKEHPPTHPNYNDIMRALEMVKFQLRHGNDLLAMDSLTGCDVNLQEQGMLLRQHPFIVYLGRKKRMRHVFLFEEMVIFSKTKRGRCGHDTYSYKSCMKLSDLGLTENVRDSPDKFELWFRRRSRGGDNFVLQAMSSDVRNIWLREISQLLWKQAVRNRGVHLSEMARMGMGNKPCIDLKLSKHNINDRFVDISKMPRVRNSIAVASFDQSEARKRPHSIISLSSCSSSSSGNQSAYSATYGAFAPLGVMLESPLETTTRNGCYNTCDVTLESNESGIVADISLASSPVDACTQTTLKRPVKRVADNTSSIAVATDDSAEADCAPLVLTTEVSLGTDV